MMRSFTSHEARRAALLAGEILISGGDEDTPATPESDAPGGVAETPADTPTADAVDGMVVDAPVADAPAPDATAADIVDAADAVAADEPLLPEVPTVAETLSGVDDAELRTQWEALNEAWSARRPHAATERDVTELTRIRAEQERISAELTGRTERATSVVDGLAALDAATPELPAAAPAFASAAHVAAARTAQPPATQQPTGTDPKPRAVLVASAGTAEATAGSEMDWATLGLSVDAVKTAGDGSISLAKIPGFMAMRTAGADGIPEALTDENTVRRNGELIAEAVADFRHRKYGAELPPTRIAAICDPLDIIRDIPDAFVTTERVAPVFPQRPIGRLGFQFMPSMTLSQVSAGSTVWNETNQAAVDPTNPATWKPIVDITCPPIQTARAEAVTAALRFDITLEMSNPERLQNATNALMAVKTRNKEARLLTVIDSLSGKYTFTGDYGALPTFVKAVNSLTAQLASADRLDESRLTMLIPRAVSALLGTDRSARAYGQDLTPADVLTELRAGLDGVADVVETLDWGTNEPGYPLFRLQEPADPEIAIPPLAGEYRVRLFDPTGAIYGETGEMNMGVQRSPDLLRMNKSQLFVEEFFVLAKHGPQHWATIDMQLCDNGARAGLINPPSCTNLS